MPRIVVDTLTLIGALGVAFGVFVWVSNTSTHTNAPQLNERQQETQIQEHTTLTSTQEHTEEPADLQVYTEERKVFLGGEQPKEQQKEEDIVEKVPEESLITAKKTEVVIPEPSSSDPYDFSPYDVVAINDQARAALVNILCESSSSDFKSISGSGIIIDPRGVILTNAHIAQHVLLSEHPQVPVSCTIRTGSPAQPAWRAQVLFIPPAWVQKHAPDIEELHASGTGEDDYALLLIKESATGALLPTSFPSISSETREEITVTGESVLVAGYPAEFGGSSAARNSLYASTATSDVQEVLTFESGTIDVLSLGSTPLAQSGSSGGAVVNLWGKLVGIVVTTSDGATTGTRDLRATTLSHVNRSLSSSTGTGLSTFLEGNVQTLFTTLSPQNESLLETLIAYTALRN